MPEFNQWENTMLKKMRESELLQFGLFAAYLAALVVCLAMEWVVAGGLLALPAVLWMLYLLFFGEDGGGYYRTVYRGGRAVHQWMPYR